MRILSLFAKHWTPGRVKTRLAATIGDERAAQVYRAFVTTLIARLANTADQRTLWFAPANQHAAFAVLLDDAWRLCPQAEGHLEERLAHSFTSQLQSPDDRCVLLGTDSPNVPIELIERAFAALCTARLVLGPTDDGGYYLIGARSEPPPVLDRMPFSTSRLWQATLDRLAALGWQEGDDYVVLPVWYDVDTVADLDRLRDDLERTTETDDPHLRTLAKLLARWQ